jgi:antitoxin component of MazEF toxin-antitoxin module
MKSVVRRWGVNLAIRIPPQVAQQLRLKEDQPVDIEVADGKLIIKLPASVSPIKKEA